MKRLIIAAVLALTLAMSGNVYAVWTISGTFGLPFDPNETWSGQILWNGAWIRQAIA